VALGRGVRTQEARAVEIARPRAGSEDGKRAVSARSGAHGRKGFGGEHPFIRWSRRTPESPRIGYAPLESQTKRWATESLIEGWFPFIGERHGCDVIGQSEGRPGGKRLVDDVNPAVTHATASARGSNPDSRWNGEVRLDPFPDRRPD
jgi:hypothetical protein